MRILVTNDDGVYAEGIRTLAKRLEPLGEVFIVAPDRPRSATGHSITLHKPLPYTASTCPMAASPTPPTARRPTA